MKPILILLALALHLSAASVCIRVTVPDWARYKTVEADGTVWVWENRPTRVRPDVGAGFWWCNEGRNMAFSGPMVQPKHWERTLRRIR